MSIKDNLESVRRRIDRAARSSGRPAEAIKLAAVIKNVPLDLVEAAVAAGLTDFGENRIQEAAARNGILREKFPHVCLHLIGHLQRNKVRQALDMFDIIQSVDSERLAREIQARAAAPVQVLLEVNTSGEKTKFGVELSAAIDLARLISSLNNVKLQGLMTVGPAKGDPRPAFKSLRQLSDRLSELALPGVEMKYLSMGMSGDFEIAIVEGSNLVRLGQAIFKGG